MGNSLPSEVEIAAPDQRVLRASGAAGSLIVLWPFSVFPFLVFSKVFLILVFG